MREWIKGEPGVLVLTGTDFRIVYQPNASGDFVVMRGNTQIGRHATLVYAKSVAEGRQAELDEIVG